MNNKVTNIFIAENVPGLNKGEMTILEGMLESFKVLGNVKVSILSMHPHIDNLRYEPKIRVFDIHKVNPGFGERLNKNIVIKTIYSLAFILQHIVFFLFFKIIKAKTFKIMRDDIWRGFAESDVIIFGHNGTFGIGGGFGTPFLYPLWVPVFSKMLGKPVVIYGGSIPPRTNRLAYLTSKLLKFAMGLTDLITLREPISLIHLSEMGFRGKNTVLTADPAVLLKPSRKERVREILKHEGIVKNNKPLIGLTVTRKVSVRAFPFINQNASYAKHTLVLAEIVDFLTEDLGATVIFIPHCVGHTRALDDRIVAQDILNKCLNKDKIKVLYTEYNAADLKGLIGECDLFIGERVHSLVNSMTMCVPSVVLGLSDDQRLDIIKMIGQENAICFVDKVSNETVLAKIIEIWGKRTEIRKELFFQTEKISQTALLNGELLKKLLISKLQQI